MRKDVLAAGVASVAVVMAGCASTAPTPRSSAETAKIASPPAPRATGLLPRRLQDVNGSGDRDLPQFTSARGWSLEYSFSCAAFGQQGNFEVDVTPLGATDPLATTVDLGPDELGTGSSGTDYEPQGGTFSLSVLSECVWHVEVLDAS